MLTLEIILGILVKAALLLYIIKKNVLVNNIYMYIYMYSLVERSPPDSTNSNFEV